MILQSSGAFCNYYLGCCLGFVSFRRYPREDVRHVGSTSDGRTWGGTGRGGELAGCF